MHGILEICANVCLELVKYFVMYSWKWKHWKQPNSPLFFQEEVCICDGSYCNNSIPLQLSFTLIAVFMLISSQRILENKIWCFYFDANIRSYVQEAPQKKNNWSNVKWWIHDGGIYINSVICAIDKIIFINIRL
jgi:hypothetical protein